MIFNTLNLFLIIIFILVSIAFFTLLERKVLGYRQLRKGPNKIRLIGLLQPISDAVKLFIKEKIFLLKSNNILFNLSGYFFLLIGLILWVINPVNLIFFFNSRILIFLCISRVNVYCILFAGWRSNSKYSLLGSIRNISQLISYEIRIFLIFVNILIFLKRINLFFIINNAWNLRVILINMVFLLWIISILAELGRAPLDFNEGERELVSGFNTEYGGNIFAFIFIAEYINILFVILLTSCLFIGKIISLWILNRLIFMRFSIVLCILILIIRSRYPRFRYDILINLTWKRFLPIRILILIINCCLH